MRIMLLLISLWVAGMSAAAAQQAIVFVDGTRMTIQSYEIKGGTIQFTTTDGKFRSVPRSYVNLEATEEANGSAVAPQAPAPPRPPAPSSPPAPKPELVPTEQEAPEHPMAAPVPAPPPAAPRVLSPPPVWSNDELQVSLQVPSGAWHIDDMPASFDVAVALESAPTEARVTLALIRQELRGEKDFRAVLSDIESSISGAPGYQSLANAEVQLDPYTAHEFRFTRQSGSVDVYNRLVVVYSQDLAYVLSLTCPESRLSDNEADFDALARGLVIRKPRNQLTF